MSSRGTRSLVSLFLTLTSLFSFTPLVLADGYTWTQSNWVGGSGQTAWDLATKYSTGSGVDVSLANAVALATNNAWFNTSWKYRQNVTVTNGLAGSLTDYQVPLFLNTATLIAVGKMKSDCSDLRLTDSSGNLLSHWLATSPDTNICNRSSTKVWVKATSLASGANTLYLYYGNAAAAAVSSGSAVFPVFADFTSGSTLPAGWVKTDVGTSGMATVGSGYLAISNTNGTDVWVQSYGATHAYNNATVNGSFVAETLLTSQSNSDVWAKTGISVQNSVAAAGSNGQAFIITTPGNGYDFQYQITTGQGCTAGVCDGVVAANNNLNSGSSSYPSFLRIVKDDSNQLSGYRSTDDQTWIKQGDTVAPWGVATNQYVTLFVTPHNVSGTSTATYTFFYTRKYASSVPSVSAFGSEQSIYLASGTLTSSIYTAGVPVNLGTLSYTGLTPANTSLQVKVRTSNSASMVGAPDFATCNAIASGVDVFSNNCVTDGQRYMQYQVLLSTTNATATPTFQSLTLGYDPVTYAVTYSAGVHGSITGSTSQTVTYGGDATQVTAVADMGYHFTNWSDESTTNPRTDANITNAITVTANFAANDTQAPVISNITSSSGSASAQLLWTTDESASSQVQYGLNTNYGFSTVESDTGTRVTNHQIDLVSLKPCARYYYRVISKDATNNQAVSSRQTFSTTGCAASTISSGTENTLPTTGGEVQLTNNFSTATLVVPNNYAASQATFQINKLSTDSAPSGPAGKAIVSNNFYDLIAVTGSNEQLSTFVTPITFKVSYGADTEASYDEASLDVYKYDGSNWIKKNCSLNTADNTLTCSLSGFSVYGVLGSNKATSTTSTTSISSSTSSSSTDNKPGDCGDAPPASSPDLFQVDVTDTTAKIFFTPISNTADFVIAYSKNAKAEEYGATINLAKEGVQNFTIAHLNPNSLYYLKVRGQHGCKAGGWSNTFAFRTQVTGEKRTQSNYKNRPLSTMPKLILTSSSAIVPQPNVVPTPAVVVTNTPVPRSNSDIQSKKCFLFWCW